MVPLLLPVVILLPVAIRFLVNVKIITSCCCCVCCFCFSYNYEKTVGIGIGIVNGYTILNRQQLYNNHHKFNNLVQSVPFTRRRQQRRSRRSIFSLSQSNEIEQSIKTANCDFDNDNKNNIDSSSIPIIQSEKEDIAKRMEQVVLQYFQGVQEKDPIKIRNCFNDTAIIRDVCSLSVLNSNQNKNNNNSIVAEMKIVSATILVQRCIDFVTAHPDVQIHFYYGPICDKNNTWVFVHWYETGTWSQSSCNISPPSPLNTTTNNNNSMYVEGQTRFRINPFSYTIEEFIITRTYTEWERTLLSSIASSNNK